MDKQYSADITVTMKNGMTMQGKLYMDGANIRNETTMNGMAIVTIIRKDDQKIYMVMAAQKTVMETAYDPDKFKGNMDTSFGQDGKFELIGPDTVDGVATTKYKVTSDKTKQVAFFWLDLAKKVPVKMTSEDGSLTVLYKNYTAAPQDPALFVPPSDYQVVPMPDIPGIPGGGGGGGGGQ